ncbi:hypothetical protein BC351_10625 [Paenibacillus ferrarius]|uniref:N-acetyltransferase domain-containing protein n=1 Tax=Paenibacillus ferrarius TaxID=1469647 RepID=A0A1V4H8T9_9BACL|nr:GNAT family N-acetyltransferase [Paenibacillus ferrarius]OPH47635.1 hypothetical protein BC351_10625 [Paenibacillus ferrarius]
MNLPDNYTLSRLSIEDEKTLRSFNCYNEKEYSKLEPRTKKRLSKITKEMNSFLVKEAYIEQESALNTTFLLYHNRDLAGYISLCADSIKLQLKERDSDNIPYETIPSLKVARLAISKDFQKKGLGKLLLKYSIYKALLMRKDFCGIKFLTLDCFQHRLSYYEALGFKKNLNQDVRDLGVNFAPISLRLHIDNFLESQDF